MMRTVWKPCFVCLFFIGVLCSNMQANSQETDGSQDLFQWLEDVGGDKSLDWVRQRNKLSQAKIEAHPEFAKLNADLRAILDSDARIPMVSKEGDYYYNFWRDKKNPRGLWRRTTLAEYE